MCTFDNLFQTTAAFGDSKSVIVDANAKGKKDKNPTKSDGPADSNVGGSLPYLSTYLSFDVYVPVYLLCANCSYDFFLKIN